jgi:hypothetical protein
MGLTLYCGRFQLHMFTAKATPATYTSTNPQ